MDSSGDKKNIKYYFIAPLAVALIVLLVSSYINRSKPDIRFSLSGGLPRELLGETSTENVQLLEIRNIGKDEAQRLTIKINAALTSYKLKKLSEADKVEEFPSPNGLEIVYPSLPPQGTIKVILQSRTTIEKSGIDVSHSKGKGEEAFTGGASFRLSYIGIAIFLIYFFFMIMLLRSMAIDHLESQTKYAFNEILLKKKPFYIDKKRWNAIRSNALGNKINYVYGNIDKLESYKLLCLTEKIYYLTEEEWLSLQHKAIEKLNDIFITKINTAWRHANILEFLRITKPLLFPEKEWLELQNMMNKSYFVLLKNEFKFFDAKTILEMIKQQKPDGILTGFWDNHIQDLKNEYFRLCSQRLEMATNPTDYLEQEDLSVLSEDQFNKLKKRAYLISINKLPRLVNKVTAQRFMESGKPEWIKDDDYNAIREEAEAFIKADALSLILWDIIYNKALPVTKPAIFTEEEWIQVISISQRFKKMDEDHQASMEEQKIARAEKEETEKLKEKIEKQLGVINDILIDPASIDRIEDYSNVFAPGNFDNLKKISQLLLKQE